MPVARRILVATSSVASALALAGSAEAATVATDPCVRTSPSLSAIKNMPVTGSGFSAGASVTVRYSSAAMPMPSYLTAVTADPAGNIATAVIPPLFAKFDTQLQTFNLVATEDINPANIATASFQQVRIGYLTNPPTGKPSRTATHTARGFPENSNVYLHFRFGGKTRRNIKLGKALGVCGVASKRFALLPTRSRAGRWTVYVDGAPGYHKGTLPQLKYGFTITRRFA